MDEKKIEILDDLSMKEVKVKMEVEVTFNLDDDCETDNIEDLANEMVSNTLEYNLNTCYGNETFVDYHVSNVKQLNK